MMKKILVISNTAFSVEKFREHYLSKINDYKFIIYTPNKLANLKKNTKILHLKNLPQKISLGIYKYYTNFLKILILKM